ncbi:MAG TPA: MlaD family protein [Gemmatimonadaceae bacterium]|nr:MlaD family protein [Gemmatimonadaceae bacterium]
MTAAMSRRGGERARVAVLVGIGTVAFIALLLFARRPVFLDRQHEYRTTFRNVAGLNVGDEVRYGGVRVGSVTALDINSAPPSQISVRFRVRRDTPVRADTRASITQLGLLGQPYLALEPGPGAGPILADGAAVGAEDNLSIQDAMRRLGSSLDRADSVFAQIDRLASANPLARLDTTLARADTLVRGATAGSERLLTRLDNASSQLATLLARSERLVGTIDTAVAQARPGLTEAQREALETFRETRTLVLELREALGQGGGVTQLVRNLNSASENVARLSARLERDPATLLLRRGLPAKPSGPALRD